MYDAALAEVLRIVIGVVRHQMGAVGGHQAYLDLDRAEEILDEISEERAVPRDLSRGVQPIDARDIERRVGGEPIS